MKVAVIGHTGMGGTAITDILLARGHEVTGVSLDGDKAEAKPGLVNLAVDVWDGPALRDALRGHDVVVSAFSGGHEMDPIVYYRQAEGTRRIIKAFKESGAGYLVYIGGAASLFVKPGVQMYDDERFPCWYFGTHPASHLRWLGDITGVPMFYEAAERREKGDIGPYESDPQIEEAVKDWSRVWLLEGCRIALDLFEGRSDFRWSFLSPPWQYRPGTGCGEYETGVDYMIFKNGVPSGISVPDLALAVCDEVDNQALEHKHWTIAAPQVD